jgi:glycosyltransferase involved in cell wall biosynthesis
MRVLHVIPGVAQRYGGPSHAIVGMGRALQREDVRVLIATTDADGQGRLPVRLEEQVDWAGVPAIFFRRQWSEALKYSRPLATWLNGHVGEFQVVHIHAIFSHSCVAAAQACRRRGVPYIVRPLGTLDPWSLQQKAVRKRVFWHLGVKQMLGTAAAIQYTTASEQALAEVPLRLERGVVIPLGVDDALFSTPRVAHFFRQQHPAISSDPYVLVLGRLHPKKGLELFFDVFLDATSAVEQHNWRLVVAGDGDTGYVASLKRWVHQRGAGKRIVFTGWLGGMDKIAALQGAAILALPSRQENFGLVVAEALACGVPVLISEHVNLAREIEVSRSGWVTPLERTRLLETVREALLRGDERLLRGGRASEFARAHFHWSTVAAELVNLYRAVGCK